MQIDGIELMSELLQNESWSHIPIIGKHSELDLQLYKLLIQKRKLLLPSR